DDGNQFLWISERNGGKQLELHNKKTAEIKVLTTKEFGLQSFVDVDCKKGFAYCLASSNPTQSQLFQIALDGKSEPTQITKSRGVHSANFSKDHSIYVHDESLHDAMPQSTVHHAGGKLVGTIPSVAEEAPVTPNAEFIQLDDEHKFYARLVRPQNFDPYLSYPVLVDVYGGPGSIKVIDSKRSLLLDQWLADQGFVVVSLDGRGTPGRGRDFERAVGLHFGSVPLDDQVSGIQQLSAKYKELDDKRIGITGWSFGGYMSALAALRRPDIYKAAVAGAPVVDWFDYDSCYTERYLGLPEKHPEAYKESSLLTYAHDLKVPLLLVHGTTDDNVFFKHSLKLADALFRNGQTFEILPLSGLTHMVPDPVVMEQLWTRIITHFQKHLGIPQQGTDRD
ncbi:MAG: prolyl oligopeptidase family serine peptidase, partial [Candidatus Obscuribacterales bacterium]|nr:prolyl oligopeptidase family serine peptidase [Candidatus Obscuribacterales bacterium]